MEKLRIMSFDLDSFTLVKSKEERSKRVIDYINNLDVDIALLQGDKNLLYNSGPFGRCKLKCLKETLSALKN